MKPLTKVKLAILLPDALTIGCEVRQKIWSCQRGEKETIFFTATDRKTISERLETLFNEKNHIAMQNTPPKQENNIKSWPKKVKINRFYPNFAQLYAQPRTNISYHRLWYFIQIPYLSKFSNNTFRNLEILYKLWNILITRRLYSVWDRHISANNLTLIFNFNNFTHNPRTNILYHCFWYFIQIPYLSKFRATLFRI